MFVFVEIVRNSEAGNRTPVVRVTGGNTKPLYYFGTVGNSKLFFISFISTIQNLFNIWNSIESFFEIIRFVS